LGCQRSRSLTHRHIEINTFRRIWAQATPLRRIGEGQATDCGIYGAQRPNSLRRGCKIHYPMTDMFLPLRKTAIPS
jgi:hypothetical protein